MLYYIVHQYLCLVATFFNEYITLCCSSTCMFNCHIVKYQMKLKIPKHSVYDKYVKISFIIKIFKIH